MSEKLKQLDEKMQLLKLEADEKIKKVKSESEERLKQLAAQKAALLTREKEKARKARTKHLIELGGLLEIAELSQIDKDILLGGFLGMAKRIKENPDMIRSWKDTGGKILKEREDARKAKTKKEAKIENDPTTTRKE